MGDASLGGNGNGSGNLAYTRFLFVMPRGDDDAQALRLRGAGANIARGFFNDFDINDAREGQVQAFESIQFLIRHLDAPAVATSRPCISAARYAVQITSKYRPRLQEVDEEFRRRMGDGTEIMTLEGAARNPRYSSPEMTSYSYKGAPSRRSGRSTRNAIILPMRKTQEWWQMTALERHGYFYPHADHASARPVKGHAISAEKGIPSLFRRVYHNPDGYQRTQEFDFITYFECDDDGLPVFEEVMTSLRDVEQNPEWRFVEEGPLWKGHRVLRW